jgi:CheY-like chemotaxis protein
VGLSGVPAVPHAARRLPELWRGGRGSSLGRWEAPVDQSLYVVSGSLGAEALLEGNRRGLPHFQVCGEAVDGDDAIEKAKELKPDLILLDLLMPGMNGVEITSVLKAMMPEVPIILLTAHDDKVGKALAPVAGASVVVEKQDGMNKLIEFAQGLLERY